MAGGHRGWARIVADAIGQDHDVSFTNLARPGATASSVRGDQLPAALDHAPHIASLIVGLNDTLRSDWNARQFGRDVHECADMLTSRGALLLTAQLHDHSRVFHLPRFAARHLTERIDQANGIPGTP